MIKISEEDKRIKAVVSVERVRFYKNEWGIAEVSINEVKQGTVIGAKYNTIVIKGTMPELIVGNMYNLTADYVCDDKWGDQYDIVSIYTDLNCYGDNPDGKRKFLNAVFTPLQVQNMYEVLEDPFTVLQNQDANELVKVKGCGMKNAASWITRFEDNIHLAQMYSELDGYGLTNNMMNRLLDRYKSPDVAIEKIKNNPYILCTEVEGIGWKTADRLALEGGIAEYDVKRVSAYILHYLGENSGQGNDYITTDELMGALIEGLGEDIPDEAISAAIHENENKLWWNDEKTLIGMKYYRYLAEQTANHIARIMKAKSHIFPKDDYKTAIRQMEAKQGWNFTEEQLDGIEIILNNNVCVITGSAGTGKSTLVSAVLKVLGKYSFAQCALSGRAGSRMAEITGEEGYTIHRLLGYPCQDEEYGKNGFTFHDENQLPYDIIIVDEISMIDAQLFYYLIRAVQTGSKLIMLGDPGQLEPIGNGNIAQDLISCPDIPTVHLTQIQRQSEESAIVTESMKVISGVQLLTKGQVGKFTFGELQDLTIDCYSDRSNTFYKIMQRFSEYMNEPDFNIMSVQIIVPMKSRGDCNTHNINNTIQEMYNPPSENKNELVVNKGEVVYVLRDGDKVINTRNNYKTDPPIFNGNIGVVKEISLEEDFVTVEFLGIGIVQIFNFKKNGSLELGYAVTVHKMQGSEFDNIIFGLDYSSYPLLNRNLLYTGMTRAKKKCDLICETNALRKAIATEWVSKKKTHLKDAIYNELHPKVVF